MRKTALILGGTDTGLQVARKLACLGHPVTLVPYSQLTGFQGEVGDFVAHIGPQPPGQEAVRIRAAAIILAVENGQTPGLPGVAALLSIALDDQGAVATNQFWPVLTNREGIFVVDGGKRPADQAAAMAACVLAEPMMN